MAYQEQTTLANPAVLINNLVNFATANGWTAHRNDIAGPNRTATLSKSGVTDYIHIYNTNSTHVRMRISIGYDETLPPSAQEGVSGESSTLLLEGPYPRCFFFASQDQVWATVAVALSGEYRHFTFGCVDKAGEYVGGTYVEGTDWPVTSWPASFSFKHIPFGVNASAGAVGYIRADVPEDGREEWFHPMGNTVAGSRVLGETGQELTGTASALVARADRNAFSGRSILHVIPLWVERVGSAVYYSPLGTVQDVRYCSINKFEPEQELTIGDDVWKVFPVAAKRPITNTGPAGPAGSGDYAYAIKKVP